MSDLLKRIAIDPTLSQGKPVIRGKRYPVEAMLEYLSAGDTIEELLVEFPDLEKDDLLACIEFASRALKLKGARLPLIALLEKNDVVELGRRQPTRTVNSTQNPNEV